MKVQFNDTGIIIVHHMYVCRCSTISCEIKGMYMLWILMEHCLVVHVLSAACSRGACHHFQFAQVCSFFVSIVTILICLPLLW